MNLLLNRAPRGILRRGLQLLSTRIQRALGGISCADELQVTMLLVLSSMVTNTSNPLTTKLNYGQPHIKLDTGRN